jgi:hypothetical protein
MKQPTRCMTFSLSYGHCIIPVAEGDSFLVTLRGRPNCHNDQEVCVPSHMAAVGKTHIVVTDITCKASEVFSLAGLGNREI